MAKNSLDSAKLQVPAGAANPSPPIGPALGQRGLNIMEFCKAFNAQTQKIEKDTPIPVGDHDLSGSLLHLRDEDAAGVLFSQEGGKASTRAGSKTPGRDMVGQVTKAQVREIAEQNMKDLNAKISSRR